MERDLGADSAVAHIPRAARLLYGPAVPVRDVARVKVFQRAYAVVLGRERRNERGGLGFKRLRLDNIGLFRDDGRRDCVLRGRRGRAAYLLFSEQVSGEKL